jgi:hypothetical protein
MSENLMYHVDCEHLCYCILCVDKVTFEVFKAINRPGICILFNIWIRGMEHWLHICIAN